MAEFTRDDLSGSRFERVVVNEEWHHRRFAEWDLDAL
jgi:hypothetical protein